MPITSLHQMGF